MNKNIKIQKTIPFPKMIGEITAISLEKSIENVSSDSISGKLILSGKYKTTTASQIEEDFYFELPFDIHFTENLDVDSIQLEITDFVYEITDTDSMNCDIELNVEGIELLDDRECDGDPIEEKEIEFPHIEEINVIEDKNELKKTIDPERDEDLEEVIEEDDGTSYIFGVNEKNEVYGTFIVYIAQENETLNQIIEKFHTSLEEIEKYNNIKEITSGTKIIIPYPNEENS
ncbi:MAG: LysM peptidoglycan-binding domain-containing protein [Bacilli bacterium]|nr:LysM peptidoglycan-binding domain-containing protein [Bacilli bacterium]